MGYILRRFRDSDAEALSAICHDAIADIGPRAYSEEQVAAWMARHPGPERYRERAANGATIYVAVNNNDHAVAYCLLEPDGHLDHLYCDPKHTRMGLAERVLSLAEDDAQKRGIPMLFTEASELAKSAFERSGYAVTHRRDFTIPFLGRDVAIHNYAMEKSLR